MKTPLCTISKSKTTRASNWKVTRDRETGRQGALGKDYFHFGLQFSVIKQFMKMYI